MSLLEIPFDDLRAACRRKLVSCELWLRQIVHDKLQMRFGDAYLHERFKGELIFSEQTQGQVKKRLGRSQRAVDGMTLGELKEPLCNSKIFHELFQECFELQAERDKYGFVGHTHVRLILTRLSVLRNALFHERPISVHDAERVLCYCDDIIVSLINYYERQNMERQFNAPTFVKFLDSLGNEKYIESSISHLDFSASYLHSGQSLRLEVVADTCFEKSTYDIHWTVGNMHNPEVADGNSFCLLLTDCHVNEQFSVSASLKSKKSWHRHGAYDAYLTVKYKVLPSPGS